MKIKATVPTVYDLDTLTGLGWGWEKHSGGHFSATTDQFNSWEEFNDWLKNFKEERYDPYTVVFSEEGEENIM